MIEMYGSDVKRSIRKIFSLFNILEDFLEWCSRNFLPSLLLDSNASSDRTPMGRRDSLAIAAP